MLPKGILFDLDDTIIAFDAVSDGVWRRVCAEFAGRCGVADADRLYGAVTQVARWYWSNAERHRIGRLNLDATRRQIVRLALDKLGLDNPPAADQIADAYSVQREEAIVFLPGAEETLRRLVDRGVSLALMTNGEAGKQRNKIRRFRLERFFGTILIEGEMGFGKPERAVYLRALEALALGPSDVWAVGDNLEWDVSGPQALGIFAIWNDFRGKGLPPSAGVVPDRIIRSISELIE